MDMTKDFAQWIADNATNSIITEPDTGEKFNGKTLYRIDRKSIDYMYTFDLPAVVAAIRGFVANDGMRLIYPLWVEIPDEHTVSVCTTPDAQRIVDRLIKAQFSENSAQGFTERFMDYEEFMIGLSSKFVENDDLKALRSMLAKISAVESDEVADDGVTQKATFKSGISLKQEGEIRAKFTLAPFRTFLDVEQPASSYLLRVRPDKSIGIFCADGGMWKYRAVGAIRNYLRCALETFITDGAVILV